MILWQLLLPFGCRFRFLSLTCLTVSALSDCPSCLPFPSCHATSWHPHVDRAQCIVARYLPHALSSLCVEALFAFLLLALVSHLMLSQDGHLPTAELVHGYPRPT